MPVASGKTYKTATPNGYGKKKKAKKTSVKKAKSKKKKGSSKKKPAKGKIY